MGKQSVNRGFFQKAFSPPQSDQPVAWWARYGWGGFIIGGIIIATIIILVV